MILNDYCIQFIPQYNSDKTNLKVVKIKLSKGNRLETLCMSEEIFNDEEHIYNEILWLKNELDVLEKQ